MKKRNFWWIVLIVALIFFCSQQTKGQQYQSPKKTAFFVFEGWGVNRINYSGKDFSKFAELSFLGRKLFSQNFGLAAMAKTYSDSSYFVAGGITLLLGDVRFDFLGGMKDFSFGNIHSDKTAIFVGRFWTQVQGIELNSEVISAERVSYRATILYYPAEWIGVGISGESDLGGGLTLQISPVRHHIDVIASMMTNGGKDKNGRAEISTRIGARIFF